MGGEATKEKIRRAIVIIYILMLPVASVFIALAGLCAHIPPHPNPTSPFLAHCFAQTHCVKPQESCGASGGKRQRMDLFPPTVPTGIPGGKKGEADEDRAQFHFLRADRGLLGCFIQPCEICLILFAFSFSKIIFFLILINSCFFLILLY